MEKSVLVQKADEKRLTVRTTVMFIVGEIAGTGILTLPGAVEDTGWIGLVLIVLCCLIAIYTGHVLGEAWCMVRDRYEEYRSQVRYPYPAIGEVTYGKPGKYLVSFCINAAVFGTVVILLLLTSQNSQSLLQQVQTDVSFCYWLIIVALVLTPVTWFGTPKDFWPVAVVGTAASCTAGVVLFANTMKDTQTVEAVHHRTPGFLSFSAAFGTMCFSFAGHQAFPTFQADMKDEKMFGKAVVIAFSGVLVIYLPLSAAGYFVYGDLLNDNVLQTVSRGPLSSIVEIVITLHITCAFVIVLNPFSQNLEEILNLPKEFTWKRCVLRTFIVAVVLFVAESVPHIGPILSLVGGSTFTMLIYIFPPVFYHKLCRMEGTWERIPLPLHRQILNYVIVFVGVLAGSAATYSAIATLAEPGAFTVPCYVNVTAALGKNNKLI